MKHKKQFISLLLILAMLLPLLPVTAGAATSFSGTCGDNLTWVLEDGVLTISGTGDMTDYTSSSSGSAPWRSYTVTSVILEDGVTSIGNYAFYSTSSRLRSAELPDTLTKIGDYAFYATGSLTSIELPNALTQIGNSAFYKSGLKTLEIPDSVTQLGLSAFAYTPLTTVTVPGSVQEISANLFYHSSLVSVILEPGITKIQNEAFAYCSDLSSVSLPDGLTQINYGAFYANYALSSIDIPDSVYSLGGYAFRACPLTSVDLPSSLSQFDTGAFFDCDNLTEFIIEPESEHYSTQNGYLLDDRGTILMLCPSGKSDISDLPAGVTRLGNHSLRNCKKFTDMIVPDHITYIDGQAFSGCTNMTDVYIPDSVTGLGGGAFLGCSKLTSVRLPQYITEISGALFSGCSALPEIDIPGGATSIGASAFDGCRSLTSLVIPDAVTAIGDNAFSHCEGLTSLELPDSLQTIGEYVFNRCISLSEITIPAGVTLIGESSFCYCAGLKKIIFLGDAPRFAAINSGPSESMFLNVTATVYYPEGNETWTEEVMQQYGGTITWVAGDGTEPEAPAADLDWHYENGVLTVSGSGPMGDYTQTTMPWIAHQNEVTSIVINEGITSIGSWAFCQFGNVTSVSIPSTVTRIGTYAFFNADSLAALTLPEGVSSIESHAFSNCSALAGTLLLPATLQDVGSYAFSECSSVVNLRAEAGLLSLGEGAFSDCGALQIVSLPGTVEEIDLFAFGDCASLREISMDDANTRYYSLDGVLFTEGGGTLIQYPAGIGGIYHVPQQVTYVESHAFRNCGSLQEVVFPADAPAFGQYAFYNTEATVRYPMGNSTWIDSVKQDYGGYITWMANDTREAVPAKTVSGTFSYRSNVTEATATYPFYYDDNWFSGSAKRFNHDLARMSLRMAISAAWTDSGYIEDLFDDLGLSCVTTHYPTPTLDTIGYAIGSKKILNTDGETVTLIAVAVRGGGYGAEWGNNFLVGSYGDHQGFAAAADTVSAAVKDYIAEIGADANVRIWVTGFSRAAATANLTAQLLNRAIDNEELLGLTSNDLYAYCFACPQGTVDPCADPNIINIVGGNDVVPLVAPSEWYFSRHGTTYYIATNATAYNQYVYEFYDMQDEYIAILKQAYLDQNQDTVNGPDENTAIIQASAEALKLTSFFEDHDIAITALVDAVSGVMSRTQYQVNLQSHVVNALGSPKKSGSGIADAIKMFFDCKQVVEYYFDSPYEAILDEIKGYLLPSPLDSIQAAHYPEFYLAWLDSMDPDPDLGIDNTLLLTQNRTRKITQNCPVDISVYDSKGTLVAQILDGEVQKIEGSTIIAFVDRNGQKTVLLPFDEEFRIETTATGDGTMSYQVEEYNIASGEATRIINYYDVSIEEGDILTGTAGTGVDTAAQYSLTDPEGDALLPSNDLTGEEILQHTVSVSAEGNGTVTGGGLFVTGEYALITAQPAAQESFLGWYAEETLISSDLQYRFRVEADVQIVGKFTESVPPVIRLSGKDRYLTAFAVANRLKELMGVEQFSAVVVAYGQNFPDALTGSYLAAVKEAPILLTEARADDRVLDYIRSNLKAGGKVYILGGTAAVSQYFEDEAKNADFDVVRLKDKNRYGTNLAILREAGVNADDEILIATGKNYADSLSASATGLPMLLVDKTLNADQIEFLKTTSGKFVIIGGTGAVSQEIEDQLNEIGTAERVKGKTRYETSVVIAERYFSNPKAAVLAYAQGFPDGLCGGPLAVLMGAPLILTSNESPAAADAYIEGITAGAVTGGTGRISDDTVRAIFDLEDGTEIPVK